MSSHAAPHWRSFRGFGTGVELALWPAVTDTTAADAALKRAVAFLRRAEASLSRFLPDSDIARINRRAGTPVHVSQLTFDAVAVTVAAAASTGGLFDPTVHNALVAAGYDHSFERIGSDRSVTATPTEGSFGRFRDIVLDPAARTVCVPAGAGLDLGGIAKGWLADAVGRRLRRHGAVMADLGGDIALSTPPPGQDCWEIEVADPHGGPGALGVLRLSGGGVATSGVLRRRWTTPAGVQHHIIDPRTGQPAATDLLAVTVAAPTAAAAEVAAKVVLLVGAETGRQALVLSEALAAVLVPADGPVIVAGAFGTKTGIAWEPETSWTNTHNPRRGRGPRALPSSPA